MTHHWQSNSLKRELVLSESDQIMTLDKIKNANWEGNPCVGRKEKKKKKESKED